MDLPQIGDMIGEKYRVEEVLGEGSFGCVFRCVAEASRREVAVKVLKPGRSGYDLTLVRRFMRELRAIAKLQSPYTLTLFDYGRTDVGMPYMVTEYVAGRDLNDLLATRAALTERETAHVVMQLLLSLAEAHEHGILHRDIKPSNIRIYQYGDDELRAKLLDFGLAQSVHKDEARLTKTGKVIGTPRYMSPEQLRGKSLTPATDIYSLGVVALECVLGGVASHFKGVDGPPRITASDPISPALRAVLNGMLAIDPDDRRSASETYDELRAARAELRSEVGMAGPIRETAPPTVLEAAAAPEQFDPRRREPRQARKNGRPPVAEVVERRLSWRHIVLGASASFGLAVLSVMTSRDPAPTQRPVQSVVSAQMDPGEQEAMLAYEDGLEAYRTRQWLEALRHFHVVMKHPDSEDAASLRSRDYVESSIRALYIEEMRANMEALEFHPDRAHEVFEWEGMRQASPRIALARTNAQAHSKSRMPRQGGSCWTDVEHSAAEVAQLLRANRALGDCDDGAVETMDAEFTILGTGAVEDVLVRTDADSSSGRCVERELNGMRFPRLDKPTRKVWAVVGKGPRTVLRPQMKSCTYSVRLWCDARRCPPPDPPPDRDTNR